MHPFRWITAGIALLALAAIGWWAARAPEAGEGRKPAPCLALSPAALDFGASPVQGLWLRRVEVRNCGNASVTVESPAFEGPFMQVGQADLRGIEPGGMRVITVGFAPDTVGKQRGRGVLALDGMAPITLGLAGEGVIGDDCPPLITGLEAKASPVAPRRTLCAPLDAPVLLDGAGLTIEPVNIGAPAPGPSI